MNWATFAKYLIGRRSGIEEIARCPAAVWLGFRVIGRCCPGLRWRRLGRSPVLVDRPICRIISNVAFAVWIGCRCCSPEAAAETSVISRHLVSVLADGTDGLDLCDPR